MTVLTTYYVPCSLNLVVFTLLKLHSVWCIIYVLFDKGLLLNSMSNLKENWNITGPVMDVTFYGCIECIRCRLLLPMSLSVMWLHSALMCQNRWTDWGSVWGEDSWGPKELCIKRVTIYRGQGRGSTFNAAFAKLHFLLDHAVTFR